MAEEVKQKGKNVVFTILKVILGLVFLMLGVLALIRWWWPLLFVVKACLGLFLILVGVITLAIAKE